MTPPCDCQMGDRPGSPHSSSDTWEAPRYHWAEVESEDPHWALLTPLCVRREECLLHRPRDLGHGVAGLSPLGGGQASCFSYSLF